MQKKVLYGFKSADAIIKDLDKVKARLLKEVEELVAKKKKLYSNMDITQPMSEAEKTLDKQIADIFSEIFQIINQKRTIKR